MSLKNENIEVHFHRLGRCGGEQDLVDLGHRCADLRLPQLWISVHTNSWLPAWLVIVVKFMG